MFKKFTAILLVALAVVVLTWSQPAGADADPLAGKKVFTANCTSCHMRGANVINPQKTLKQDALEKYNLNTAEAIITQVKNGKGAMPAFGGRLSDTQIENVAAYVLTQAEKGWS